MTTTPYTGPTPADLAAVPDALKALPQWVLWRASDRLDKTGSIIGLDKTPYKTAPDKPASSNDPGTWTTFDRCVAALDVALEEWELALPAPYRGGGIGFVFTANDAFCGVDLDHSVAEDGSIAPWAQAIVTALDSYTQRSVSGTGLHVIVQGTLPPGRRQAGNLQMWDDARFFAMTGWHLAGTPAKVEPRQDALEALWCTNFGAKLGDLVNCLDVNGNYTTAQPVAIKRIEAAPDGRPLAFFDHTATGWPLARCVEVPTLSSGVAVSPAMPDDEVLTRAQQAANGAKFDALWTGQWQVLGYDSESEADAALLSLLAFWTQDVDQLRRLFEQSALCDKKWLTRPDYQQRTLAYVLRQLTTAYQPRATFAVGSMATATTQEKTTHVKILLKLAKQASFVFTAEGAAFARVPVNGHYEVVGIGEHGGGMRRWLVHQFQGDQHGGLPSSTALSQVMEALMARAQFEGERAEVHTRFAVVGNTLYLDLGDASWRAVEIDADGWRLVEQPAVYFRRPAGLLPLPVPDAQGTLQALEPFLPALASTEVLLIKAWLLGTLQPEGALPHLCLHGEQGSAKSTLTRILRSIVDPNTAPARSAPKEIRDLVIAASNARVVGLENLSYLPDWLSDALCCLSTGSGYGIRKNYSDNEEMLFSARRPVILNGIAEVATRPDLVDRCLFVTLPEIPERQRKPEAEVWQTFTAAHPYILGGLLHAASRALDPVGAPRFATLPRMADFALWVECGAPHLGASTGEFLAAYEDNRLSAVAALIDEDVVATMLDRFLATAGQPIAQKTWGWLFNAITDYATLGGTRLKPEGWPRTARGLSAHVKRLAPALRKVGFHVVYHGHGRAGSTVTIEKSAP